MIRKMSKTTSRLMAAFLAAVMLCIMMAPLGAMAAGATGKTTSKVILRTGPSTDTDPIATLTRDCTVTVLGKTGIWYKVSIGSREGYVHSDYLKVSGDVKDLDKKEDGDDHDDSASEGTEVNPRAMLKKGDKGDDVKGLQDMLIALGYLTGKADGQFGPATDAAVKAFQTEKKLTADGIVGKQTWQALADEQDKKTAGNYTTLRKGDKGDAVKAMQEALTELDFFNTECTGYFGVITENAVKAFQKANGLEVDGIAGSATQTKLYGGEAEKSDLDPSSSLKKGDKGDNVKALQGLLIARGYLGEGSDDGVFGEQTRAAIKQFQAQNKLSTDGVAGPATIKALMNSDATADENAPKQDDSSDSSDNQPAEDDDRDIAQVSPNGLKLVDWWSGYIDSIWKRGEKAKVTDVRTGITFYVQRLGGTNHADWEPCTAEDTARMMEARGNKTGWTARAVWVEIDGESFAAAINGMPHGSYNVKDNNYNGHSCMHFLNSTTHATGNINNDMQAQIQYAWSQAQ